MYIKNVTRKPSRMQYQFWYLLRGIFKVLTGNYNFDTYIDSEEVYIGKDVAIGPGVKIITQKHQIGNIWHSDPRDPVHIGHNCLIGANAVILPGVTLGSYTVVGAGAIVTKSFIKGHCTIVGNPARIMKSTKVNKSVSHGACE